jgi:hypothetical protein
MENKKKIFITVLALVVLAGGLFFFKQHRVYSATGTGLPLKPDYKFVPVYTMQETQAYLNSTATPLVFVDRSDKSAQYIKQLQDELAKVSPVSPVVMVSTYFNVPVINKAKEETMKFVKDNSVNIPVVMQAGDAATYSPQVPCFIYYTIENGKEEQHVLTGVPSVNELAAATKGKVIDGN